MADKEFFKRIPYFLFLIFVQNFILGNVYSLVLFYIANHSEATAYQRETIYWGTMRKFNSKDKNPPVYFFLN